MCISINCIYLIKDNAMLCPTGSIYLYSHTINKWASINLHQHAKYMYLKAKFILLCCFWIPLISLLLYAKYMKDTHAVYFLKKLTQLLTFMLNIQHAHSWRNQPNSCEVCIIQQNYIKKNLREVTLKITFWLT